VPVQTPVLFYDKSIWSALGRRKICSDYWSRFQLTRWLVLLSLKIG